MCRDDDEECLKKAGIHISDGDDNGSGSKYLDLSKYDEWEQQLILNLMKAGPEGIHAADYIIEHDVKIVFNKPLWGGGGWKLNGNISLDHSFKDTGPNNSFVVGLIAHEAYHLEQGPIWALSKVGEIEAWKLGFTVQRNFSDRPLESIFNAIADLDLGEVHNNPQVGIDLIHSYNDSVKESVYSFMFDRLPTYPLSWYFLRV
jgi:hypothetical protein